MSKLGNFFGTSGGTSKLTTSGNPVSNNTGQTQNIKHGSGLHSHGLQTPVRVDTSGRVLVSTTVPATTIKDIHFGDIVAIQNAAFFKDIVGHVIDIHGIDDYSCSYTVRFEKNGIKHERAFDHANIRKLKATEYMKYKKEQKHD